MFKLIAGLPPFVVGIIAGGTITREDYADVLMPALRKASEDYKAISFLMLMDTGFENFTAGAWMNDIKVNVQYFLKWNKIAIVSDEGMVKKISVFFDALVPGEVRRFEVAEMQEAKDWISLP